MSSIYSRLDKINEELKKVLWLKNKYEVPRLEKIVINVWAWSSLTKWKNTIDEIVNNVSLIAWQKPIVIKTKIAVSNFKLRKWMANGVKVTLRWQRMYNFLDKLVNIVLPRTMDFKWTTKKFDNKWNYSIWIKDVTIFNEVLLDDISRTHWLQVNFSVVNWSKEKTYWLLKKFWIPFKK